MYGEHKVRHGQVHVLIKTVVYFKDFVLLSFDTTLRLWRSSVFEPLTQSDAKFHLSEDGGDERRLAAPDLPRHPDHLPLHGKIAHCCSTATRTKNQHFSSRK